MKPNIPALLRRLLPIRHLSGTRFSRRARRRLFRTEPLEVRTLLAGVSDTDTVLTIDLHEADALSVTAAGDTYTFQLSGGSFADDGVTSTAVAGLGLETLTVDINNGYSTIQITDSGTGASVVFGNSTRSFADHFDVNLSGEVAADQAVRIEGAIDFGDFNFSVVSDRTIHMPGGGAVTVNNGDLTFDGHNVGDAAGMITGIFLCGGNITSTGTGDITLRGTATSAGPNLDYHIGVDIRDGSLVTSAGTGDILIQGTGGTGASWNNGVLLFDGASIETAAGGIRIEGVAGSGTGRNNVGLALAESGPIRSTATGDGAAPVILSGTGGEGTSYNHGVMMYGVTSAILVEHGDLLVHGISGVGTDEFNAGINFYEFDRIQSNGVAGGVGQILLDGISKSSSTESTGVILSGAGSQVIAANHDLKMSGRAGQKTNGDMAGNGVHLHTDLVIQANGSVESPTHIIFDGHGTSGVVVANGVGVTAHSTDVSFHSIGQSVGSSFAGSLSVSGPGREVLISDRGTGNYRTTVAGRIEANEGAIHIQSAAEDAAEPQIWVTAQRISASVITIATAGSVRLLNTLFQSSVVRVGPYQKLGSAPVTPHSIQFFTSSGESRISATHGIQMTASHELEIYSPLITTTGDIVLQVTGETAEPGGSMRIQDAALQTESGHIRIESEVQTEGSRSDAVRLSSSTLSTVSGDIEVTGIAHTTDPEQRARGIYSTSSIMSDTGNVTLRGESNGMTQDSLGVALVGQTDPVPVYATRGKLSVEGRLADTSPGRSLWIQSHVEIGFPQTDSDVELIFGENWDVDGSFHNTGKLKLVSSAGNPVIDTSELGYYFFENQITGPTHFEFAATDARPVEVAVRHLLVHMPFTVRGDVVLSDDAAITVERSVPDQPLLEVTGRIDIPATAELHLAFPPTQHPMINEELVIVRRQSGTGTFRDWEEGTVVSELGDAVVAAAEDGDVTLQFPSQFFFMLTDSLTATNHELRWSAIEDAESYDLWMAAAGTTTPIIDTNVVDPIYTTTSPLTLGAYNIYVRPVFAGGRKGAWNGRQIKTDIAPKLQANIDPGALRLDWDEISGATNYRVVVQNIGSGQTIHDQIVGERRLTLFSTPEGRYRAWVQGISESGFRTQWSLAADAGLGPQLVSEHVNSFHGRPAIRWNASYDAAHYQLWIQKRGMVVANLTGLTETEFTFDSDLEPGEYHWWIRPTNNDGSVGAWSKRGTTQIGGRTSITRTSNFREGIHSVTWAAVEDATQYELFQLAPDGSVNRWLVDEEVTYLETGAVQSGTTEYWVRARDTNGNWGVWSAVFSRYTSEPDSLPSPVPESLHLAGLPGESVTVRWDETEGIEYDVVWMTADDIVVRTQHTTGGSFTFDEQFSRDAVQLYVRATQGFDESPYSEFVHFNFSGRTVVTAATEAGNPRPVINWVAVQGSGVVYQLQVQKIDTQEVVIREEALSENSFTSPDDLTAGTYRAWVRVLADGFSGPWSAAHEFTVG